MAEERQQKLYAYIDESGQDTRGQIFLVSVVVAGENREALRRKLREIERTSGKQTNKWVRTRPARREAYIQALLQAREFTGHVYYAQYQGTRSYVDLMIFSTGKALHTHTPDPLSATIVVDGLGRPERHRFAAGLRKLGITVRKVRGARDQSDELIRLADAIAGFVRDSIAGRRTMRRLFEEALRRGMVQEV